MAKKKTTKKTTKSVKSKDVNTTSSSEVKVSSKKNQSFLDKIQTDLETNQSYLNLVLGGLIVIVLGVLVYNYFAKSDTGVVGPSNQTETPAGSDVAKENLPGKYTVKEGDTLFIIAEKYYGDGYLYTKIIEANNLQNPDNVPVGQVLDIPKVEGTSPSASPATSTSPSPTSQASDDPNAQTEWGPKISGNSYTVAQGDTISKIAGRAYGDVYQFTKIAEANNLYEPYNLEPGQVLKIPR